MPFRGSAGTSSGSNWKVVVRTVAVLLLIALLLGGVAAYSVITRGLSAHVEPSRVEEAIALAMRRWATPAEVRTRANPIAPTDAVLANAMAHFADHCASCHANDGSGDTTIARGMYPKPPDMRLPRTQDLSDGELFWIIEHGIRLTGMPGWSTGTPDGERDSWGLVHFIRHLSKLTPEDIERMEALNPKSADQWREEEEARQFLRGEPAEPPQIQGKRH